MPPSPQASPSLSDASNEQEVIPDSQEVLTEPESLNDACNDVSSVVESSCRYELPPKSTRGIPPRRYDPDFEAQRSRYPINQDDIGNLAQTTVAFIASLYSSSIPRNTEEALQDSNWREAMKDEISALKKNSTWVKCMLPKGKRTMGFKWIFTIKFGYKQSNSDHTLFLKKGNNQITCLIIHVDDIVIIGNYEEEISGLKKKLFMEFEMKDLGNLKYFIGIEEFWPRKAIFIKQKKYILDLLAKIGMLDCKPVEPPIVANHRLQTIQGEEPADKEKYQKLVGKLVYLSHTRPDISYAVGVVSRFMHLPQIPLS